tara:strand:- start:337 stop:834 length:498 start_codon:yes stop_codon:yes gene_type:complete
MSLSFLHKKSWHTHNVANVEKVWKKEQVDEAEKKKVAELQKQLEEERQINDLRQMSAKAGGTVVQDSTMDWMYEGPAGGASSSSGAAKEEDMVSKEEQAAYLLGKEFKGKESSSRNTDVHKLKDKAGSLMLNTNSTVSRNEQFTRLHEGKFKRLYLYAVCILFYV